MDDNFFAIRLAKLRTERDVSAREMSLDIGQAHNYIANIESGKSQPSMQGFYYICEYLKISPKEFFDEGSTNPALLNELLEELKSLNNKTLEHVLALVRELKK
jgi:transcriptional regulator with XRE-family HTH domain